MPLHELDKIGIFNGRNDWIHPLKQHIGSSIKFSMHDKMRIYVVVFDNETLSPGVTQLHLIEPVPIVQVSNTSI